MGKLKSLTYYRLTSKYNYRIPCTSVKLANDEILAAGYLMGFIKIINPISGVVLAHINAHSRIITSIDIIQSDKDVHVSNF